MERFWSPAIPKVTVGLDLGDRKTELCQLDEQGQVAEQSWVATTRAGVEKRFRNLEPARVVLEAGTHSPWISRMLEAFGHEVIVANPAELYAGKRTRRRKKNDRIDAEFLARQGRADPALLFPIQHRSEETQGDLALIHSRDALVRARASLVNHVRGTVKSVGGRLPASSTPSFARTAGEQIPEVLRPALVPVLEMIQALSEQIVAFDKQIECMAEEKHPATRSLRQVTGVGALTALTYVLVLEDPKRFKRSRSVGSYLGLAPRLEETGGAGRGPELSISKTGDALLRRLLVSSAHYILGPFGPDTDLRRWGLTLAARGGKNAKKRAVVALARKLAVLLHRLWSTGEVYEPLRNASKRGAKPSPLHGRERDGDRCLNIAEDTDQERLAQKTNCPTPRARRLRLAPGSDVQETEDQIAAP